MRKTRIVGFNPVKMKADMTKLYIDTQTNMLVDYAQKKIVELGASIASYNKAHHMDDTGNLLDSLCWGVYYNGELSANGFYRPKRATQPSYLHGKSMVDVLEGNVKKKWVYPNEAKKGAMQVWSQADAGEPVHGRELAEQYISKSTKLCKAHQWVLLFAILAPYWGYWEKGFRMKSKYGSSFKQFAMMAMFYDSVKPDLKPMRVRMNVSVNKYASKSLYRQAKKNLKNA